MLPSVAHQPQHFLPHHHLDHQPNLRSLNLQYNANGAMLNTVLRRDDTHRLVPHHTQSMSRTRMQYPRPIHQPNVQDLTNTGVAGGPVAAEHTLRRKTPNGTLAAGYDGTPGDRSIQPPAAKHLLVSSLDSGQAL